MRSETISSLAMALSKAQGSFEHAKKTSANTFFKNKYADLASVIDAAKKHLKDNGLAVTQTTDITEHGLVLVTTLLHESGEWINGVYPISYAKNDPQAMGSALSYARRYCFAAITGIASDDDDGQAATIKSSMKTITPENKAAWEKAKAAYLRDGNLDAVLTKVNISEADQALLIEEASHVV